MGQSLPEGIREIGVLPLKKIREFSQGKWRVRDIVGGVYETKESVKSLEGVPGDDSYPGTRPRPVGTRVGTKTHSYG